MTEKRVIAVRRLLAFAVDWFVLVVLWGGLVFGAVMIATGGNPPQPASPWAAQGISFLTVTLPFTLYSALCESSPMRASLGKRALGLVVSRETGGAALVRIRPASERGQVHPLGVRPHGSLAVGLRGRGRFPGVGLGTGSHRVRRARVVARRAPRGRADPV